MHIDKLPVAMLLALVCSSTQSLAGPVQPYACPMSIESSQLQLVNTAPDWTPFVASPLYLHAAAPMYGPPELRGDLVDFISQRSKNEWSYTYRLEGKYPEGKWLQCAYGEYNQVTLSRRIADATLECKISYRKGQKAGQNDIRIACK